ncbi:MAG: MGMT family protein [Nocardioides sp.]
MDDRGVERVLVAVELIPPGRVASYGDLGELIGIGPRQVGHVLAVHGQVVPWWRVTNAAGEFPDRLRDEARVRWAREGIAWKPNGRGCRITEYRTDLVALGRAFESRWRHLESELDGDDG